MNYQYLALIGWGMVISLILRLLNYTPLSIFILSAGTFLSGFIIAIGIYHLYQTKPIFGYALVPAVLLMIMKTAEPLLLQFLAEHVEILASYTVHGDEYLAIFFLWVAFREFLTAILYGTLLKGTHELALEARNFSMDASSKLLLTTIIVIQFIIILLSLALTIVVRLHEGWLFAYLWYGYFLRRLLTVTFLVRTAVEASIIYRVYYLSKYCPI